jgi:uncharacterized protein (TIGR03790 family)
MAHPFTLVVSPLRTSPRPAGLAVLLAAVLAALVPLAAPRAAGAQTGRNILLIENGASDASTRIADHYAKVRDVPPDQRIKLDLPVSDEISPRDYQLKIEKPIAAWFTRNGAQDRILYLVLTKGLPLRVAGSNGIQGTIASVDSELTLLYRKLAGRAAPSAGRIDNPYFLGANPVRGAKPFSHEQYDIFLVSRLDGFTVEDVIGLIDRAKAPFPRGTFVLDMKSSFSDKGNAWLQAAADRLKEMDRLDPVVLDKGSLVITGQQQVIGYYSWGSNDPAVHRRTFDLTFVPGALAAMFVSTDGRTFTAPPDTWNVGSWDDRSTFFAGSPQSLTGDLIHAGVTGAAGHVAEPYLDATIRPEILFPAYISGFNLIESFYLAMPYLSWETIVVGDPLCAPFPRTGPSQTALDPPIDPLTELSRFFSARRVEVTAEQAEGLKPEAVRLGIRGETRIQHGDEAGAREALEQATTLEPRFNGAHLTVASLYEKRGEYEKAVGHYRRILASNPNDIIALNNLAFALAARLGKPAEAMSFAERAYELSRGTGIVSDTYGWVLHLAGDDQQALRYVQDAVSSLPSLPEIRWHHAAVLAALGHHDSAAKELAKAFELDPTLKTRTDIQALQKKLAARATPPSQH